MYLARLFTLPVYLIDTYKLVPLHDSQSKMYVLYEL